jgi:hypothetical protein
MESFSSGSNRGLTLIALFGFTAPEGVVVGAVAVREPTHHIKIWDDAGGEIESPAE